MSTRTSTRTRKAPARLNGSDAEEKKNKRVIESDSEEEKPTKKAKITSKTTKTSTKTSSKAKAPKEKKTEITYTSSMTNNLTKAQQDELNKLSVADMKDRLKANRQKSTGHKAELKGMIAEFLQNGCLPPHCPDCAQGMISIATDGTFFCKGYVDIWKYISCSYTADTVVRTPWQSAEGQLI